MNVLALFVLLADFFRLSTLEKDIDVLPCGTMKTTWKLRK